MQAILLLALMGCAPDWTGPTPLTAGDGFYDKPWPSDTRLVDGHPDLSDFPGAEEFSLIQGYIDEAWRIDGFGTNAPVYVRFDGALDTTLLPSPEESTSTDASVFLINVDPNSGYRGERVPLIWDYQPTETTWQPSELLAMQPVWGMPLRPGTTYALVITTDIASPVDGFAEVWNGDHPDYAYWEGLSGTLISLDVDRERVAYAVRFTTQHPTRETSQIAHRIRTQLPMPKLDQELRPHVKNFRYQAWLGEMEIPIWQHGESPYMSQGGGFVFDESGWPELARWESATLAVTVPSRDDPPPDGWPVVIYSHGTGGSYASFCSDDSALEPATIFAEAGLAGIGISLPFHGDRNTGGDPSLASFNYFNPESGRSTFRQAALEQVYLAELLTRIPHTFTTPDGATIPLDPTRVAYMGHSHGGEIGIIAAPYFPDAVRAVVLSGAGGGLSLSLVHREEDSIPIQDLLRDTLEFADDEELDELHPIVGMVQLMAEATDPLNYGRYWHRDAPNFDASPKDVLMFEGLHDQHTPPVATEALAGAAGQPILGVIGQQSLVQELEGIDGVTGRVANNRPAWDGSSVTAGLAQFPESDHFAIFYDPVAAHMYQEFLRSALIDGAAEVPER